MEPDQKPKRGQRAWTDAQRAAQARKIRDHQIWLKSTGPKTARGKRTSSHNSYKHGRFSYEKQILRWYVRMAALRLKQIKTHIAFQNQKSENELIDQYQLATKRRPDIMAYYPYFKVHPIDAHIKRVRTPRQKSENRQIFDYFTRLSGE